MSTANIFNLIRALGVAYRGIPLEALRKGAEKGYSSTVNAAGDAIEKKVSLFGALLLFSPAGDP